MISPVEIACDESGSEGENLLGGETDVFAHAGVRLDVASAAECVREIRERIRSPATEYKANHLLRAKHRPVLVWLLGPSGPLRGNAHVVLIDKTYFVVSRMVETLLGTDGPAMTLHREGPHTFGRAAWLEFLQAFVDLMRVSNRRAGGPPSDFSAALDRLCQADPPSGVREILESLRHNGPLAERGPPPIPVLDPLLPALIHTVDHWSSGGPVSVVHDEQPSLTAERITRLTEILGASLHGLRFVDSRTDPRVQVADFLAGTARRIASDDLAGRGDPELTALVRPHAATWSS